MQDSGSNASRQTASASSRQEPAAFLIHGARSIPLDKDGNLLTGGVKPYVMSSELERDGYMGVLEWRPNDRIHSTIDAFYSEFKNTQVLRGIEFPLAWGGSSGDCTVNVPSAVCRPAPSLRPGYTVEDGLIVAGPDDDAALPAALAALSAATGWPIVADPLSGLRCGPHDRSRMLARGDQLARPGPWIDAHPPALVVRTGAMPTSKPVTELLARTRPELWVIDGDSGWREAAFLPARYLHADAARTAVAIAERLRAIGHTPDPAWSAAWIAADRRAGEALDAWLAGLTDPFEGLPFALAPSVLPDDAIVWAGSSMPVRDLDGWLPSSDRRLRILSSRGANGIDGVTSAAAGAALAGDEPVLLVTGDVSFLHDVGGLLTARLLGVPLTILAIDNDGGTYAHGATVELHSPAEYAPRATLARERHSRL